MKKIIMASALLVVALCITTTLVLAQTAPADKPADNMQILKDKVKADKKLVVAENMQLTDSEAKAFWPIYEAYQKDLEAINSRVSAMILGYAHAWNTKAMDNKKAKKMTSDFLAIQTDEVNLIKSYVPKLDKVLPATKVARYLQIENKIRAITRYGAAAQIPLVPDQQSGK